MSTPFWRTTWFRVLIGSILSLIFIYLAVRDVPLGQVLDALTHANYAWVLLAVGLMLVQSWLKTVRWIMLFYPLDKGLEIRRMFGISVVSQMLNIVAPWRIGDLARIYLAGEIEKRSKAQILATLGTEKIFDTLMLLVMILIIPLFITLPSELEGPREGFIAVSVVLFACAVALILFGDWLLTLVRHIPISPLRRLLETHGELALGTLDVFRRWDLHFKLQALSLVVAIVGVLVNLICLIALNLRLALIVPFLLFPVLQIGGVVPSSPGKLGLFQYLCILVLGLFSVDSSLGLAYGILLYVVAYGTPIVAGLMAMWLGGISLQGLTEARVPVEGTQ